MRKSALLCFLLLSSFFRASHNRSGEITYTRIAPFTKVSGNTVLPAYWYAIRIVTYTDDDTQQNGSGQPNTVADRCILNLYFGDGDSAAVQRSNGANSICSGCATCCGDHCGELIINEAGYRVKKNIYEVVHEYPGPGTFYIRTSDPNRNAGVINMNHSDLQSFFLQSALVIGTFSGPNNSPVFTVDPVDKACIYKCFTHNPGAYDPDHDSLVYKLSTPKGANGQTVTGYFDPPVLAGGVFNIDSRSGILTWCAPTQVGEFNIAFVVEEWRRGTGGQYQLVGQVLRDMQILVRTCDNNDPPIVVVPRDTCMEAGTLLEKKISVSDPNLSNIVTLSGFGGAFAAAAPAATLLNKTGNGFQADLKWQTTCDHIARQPYQTTFKAEDNAGAYKLATYAVYNIRVIPPAVKHVIAQPAGSSIKISWDPAVCNPAANPLVKYRIYRQEGCKPFVAELCKPGVSAISGFAFIGETDSQTAAFTDDDQGEGLIVGQNYSYLVIAAYKDGSESYAGTQICTKLKRDVPILLNTDVESTSTTAGTVKIRWARPLKTEDNFDTLQLKGPYRFDLKVRDKGLFSTVFSSTANYLYQLDTAFAHQPVNTTLDSNEYLVEFRAGDILIGSSQKATSVFLSGRPSDRRIDLSWKSKTPWKNYMYTVFRKAPGVSGFTAIGTTTATVFSDTNHVVNRNSYCYYVLSEGQYSDPAIYKPLLNRSQEICVTAIDLTPPCTPTLSLEADCPKGFLTVRWKNVRALCSDDVVSYILYYKSTVNDAYQSVFETDTTYYIYDATSLISGCYAIQARDSSGNLSAMSPDFCVDNCPEFELPNVFSPNGDEVNDMYKAIKVRHIKEISLAIVDRWGNLVYTTSDPYFQWNGVNSQTKQEVSEGTFFYVCTVYEPRVNGVIKRVLKGTIQVVR